MRKTKFKTGIAFSESVSQPKTLFAKGYRGSSFNPSGLLILAPVFILLSAFLVLFVRLFYIQVIQGAYYRGLSDQNRTRTTVIPAPRGIIFDRNGKPLVRNVPVFELIEGKKPRIVSKEEGLKLITEGKNVISTVSREYLYKGAFAHVIGYTGQISPDEINLPEFDEYAPSDFTGKMGLEKQYEKILHGRNGQELNEVNASGTGTRFLGRQEPIPGENIDTTLDLDIQLAVVKAFEKVEKGAVVISDPRNGGILAIYSKPTFDSNLFTHPKEYQAEGNYKDVESIVGDSINQPVLDRAISGTYPPGSTFKLVTAAAALTTGAIKPDTRIEDTGVLKVGQFSFGNWYFIQYGRKEGSLDVVGAIKRSNDIFFYQAADRAGPDEVTKWAHLLGSGQRLGIDLPGEAAGNVPTEEWKKENIGEPWYQGDTFNYGIGQGYLLTTPLQVNFWTTAFANEGTLYKPHLVKNNVEKIKTNVVKKEYADLIRKGMEESCETGGVAFPFFNFKVKNKNLKIDSLDYSRSASDSADMVRVKLGCKTGTAETGGKETKPHAWITVFAPFNNPEIVVTVLVENGGEGSSVAGPIAKDILNSYFEKKKTN